MALIRGADPTRYGTLIAELSNQFALGRNDYPPDLNSAYSLLVNYRPPANARPRNNNNTYNNNANNPHSNHGVSTPEESAMTFA
jgi:hypothetical protein